MVKKIGPVQAPISLVIVFIYFMTFNDNKGKDNLLTKIYVLIISTFIIALLFTAYIFVYKQDNVSLTNGQATLWDTKTVELADEICVDCDTNEEKVKAIYGWVICNFEYNYDCKPIIQYFNVRKTLTSKKGICYDFAHLFTTLCRTQNIPCYVVDGTKLTMQIIIILGIEFILMVLVGMLILHLILFKHKAKVNFTDSVVLKMPIHLIKNL